MGVARQSMKTCSVLVTLFVWVSVNATVTDREDSALNVELTVNVTEHCAMNFPRPCNRYGWYRVGTRCLKYFRRPRNFTDAEFHCRRVATGGHLVSVHSHHVNTRLQCITLKHNHAHPRIWMGGLELFKTKRFIWTDGSPWNYQYWVPGQPDNTYNVEDCLEMNWKYTGRWNDDTCSVRKSYVCSYKA